MPPQPRRSRNGTSGQGDASIKTEADQARRELVTLASERLGRPLTHPEQEEIRALNNRYLVSGYYAELYKGYGRCEMIDWFKVVAKTRKELAEIQRRRDAITKSQIEEACAEVAHIAAEKVGRQLTDKERKAIRGFDKSLLVEGDIAGLYRKYSAQEILDQFRELGAGPGPVALLSGLATVRTTLGQSRKSLLEFLSPKGRKVLQPFAFEAVLDPFTGWFLDLLRTEPPGRNIRALYFGLFESGGGCRLYVSGAKAYDPEDSDWAGATDWCPQNRYAPLEALLKLWKPVRKAGNEPWVVMQAIAIALIQAFFNEHEVKFKQLTGLKRVYIISGFDDGDLYVLQTPLSPPANH